MKAYRYIKGRGIKEVKTPEGTDFHTVADVAELREYLDNLMGERLAVKEGVIERKDAFIEERTKYIDYLIDKNVLQERHYKFRLGALFFAWCITIGWVISLIGIIR